MKKRCGHGLTGKQTEELFKTCLLSEIQTAQSLSNVQDFYDLIARVKLSYTTEYRIKKKGFA